MRVKLESFFIQKAGNVASEYEDAYWTPQCCNHKRDSLRLAVADGATETSFAGLWAKLLVRSYGRKHLTSRDFTELDRCRRVWTRVVSRKPLPWYAEEKMRSGAFSSLLGLTVNDDGSWEAMAVGDSCLFHLRGEMLLTSFPMNHSLDFTSRPSLLSSIHRPDCPQEGLWGRTQGQWEVGDDFYLMTDALACWFLKRWEIGADPLEFLRGMNTQEGFERWVSHQRKDLANDGTPFLKNDDVTLVACHIE